MSKYKVINRTQGQMEITSIKRTLGPSGWVIVSGPLPDDIKFMMGGGPLRKLDVKEQPEEGAPVKGPSAVPSSQSAAPAKSGKTGKP